MERKIKYAVIAVGLLALTLGSVVAVVILERIVNTPGFIRASSNMKVLNVDHASELASIDLGGITKRTADAQAKAFPWAVDMYLPSTFDPSQQYYYLNNTNEMDFYLGFTIENAPANMIWTFACVRGDNMIAGFWKGAIDTNAPTMVVYPTVIHGSLNASSNSEKFVYWYLGVQALPEAIGETYFTANIRFLALDSPTG